jgi:hypothetical protein
MTNGVFCAQRKSLYRKRSITSSGKRCTNENVNPVISTFMVIKEVENRKSFFIELGVTHALQKHGVCVT